MVPCSPTSSWVTSNFGMMHASRTSTQVSLCRSSLSRFSIMREGQEGLTQYDTMGVGMPLNWPTGAGVKGSYGAASTIAMTVGGIGYAELSYMVANHLSTIQIQNRAGRFVLPNRDTFAAAAESADWTVPNYAVDLTDMSGEQSWPIVTATFVLVPRSASKTATSNATLQFFKWAFAHGDDAARSLQFVPLPEKVKADISKNWSN